MESRSIRRTERRKRYRRASDQQVYSDLISKFQDHLRDSDIGYERLSTVETTVDELDHRYDKIEMRLNMILGGLAVIGFAIPIAVSLVS